jgi:hypothetical protein
MKRIKFSFLFLIGFCCLTCFAQPFKVVKATRQKWSGGVAGRWGINYYIEIKTNLKTPLPDTLWINNTTYPLDFSGKSYSNKCTFDSVTHKIVFEISVSEEHNDSFRRGPLVKKDTAKKGQEKPTRQFQGVALISYSYQKKQHFLTINSFSELKPIEYP